MVNLPVHEFCREYLIREWWAGEEGIYIPAPRRNFDRKERRLTSYSDLTRVTKLVKEMWAEEERRNGKGFVVASWGHNLICDIPCVFLNQQNRCKIYEARPTECRETFGCKKKSFERTVCLDYWRKHQDWIQKQMQLLSLE